MDFQFNNIWFESISENNGKDETIEISQSRKIYNGCFLSDPQEIGQRIERPCAPMCLYTNDNCGFPIFNNSLY